MLNKNPKRIKNLFNNISQYYDNMNYIISFGLHKKIKEKCINELEIKKNHNILDLCCGTGDITQIIEEKYPFCNITGVDFSENMINIAKNKNPYSQFINADITNLPFEDNKFDIIINSFGLRNIEDFNKAIKETYRVLTPNGFFLHLDFGTKNIPSKFFDIYVLLLSKFLNKNSKDYEYLINSKKEFPAPDNLIKLFEYHNFKFFKKKDYLFNTISMQIMKKIN